MSPLRTRLALAAVLVVLGALVAVAVLVATEPRIGERTPPPVARNLTLRGATVVDVRTGRLAPGTTIAIEAGRIARVAPDAPEERGPGDVDARGKFVIPGLLDMHAHPLGEADADADLALMLANGVTGYRQMSGSWELLERRRANTLHFGEQAPALLALPGPILTPFNAGSVEDAVEAVRAQRAAGADFVKIGFVTGDVFFAVVAEAQRLGIPAAGHVPPDVDVLAAARAGLRAVEHLGPSPGLLLDCSSEAAELVAAAPKMPRFFAAPPFEIPFADRLARFLLAKMIVNPVAQIGPGQMPRMRRIVATHSDAGCARAARELAATGTWHVPTLVRLRTQRFATAPEYASDPNLRYVPEETQATWREVTETFAGAFSGEDQETLRALYALDLKLVKALDDAGVRMLAGSDAVGAGWLVPGFSLHQELDELAKAGLAPLRVLQMATIDGAEFLGRQDTTGAVLPGRDADLVLLDANPLESVANLHRIHAVVRAGRYLTPDALRSRAAR